MLARKVEPLFREEWVIDLMPYVCDSVGGVADQYAVWYVKLPVHWSVSPLVALRRDLVRVFRDLEAR